MMRLLQLKKSAVLLSAFFMSLTFVNTLQAQTFAWARSLGSGSNEEGRSVAVDASGNVYSTGYFTGSADFDPGSGIVTLTSAGSSDVYISKLDALGNFIWALRLGGTGPQIGTKIALDNSGNIYVVGHFNNTIDVDPSAAVVNITSLGSQDVFVAKYAPTGTYLWSKHYGSTAFETITDIAVDAVGNVLMCGSFTGVTDFDPGAGVTTLTASTSSDAYISKLDANGNYVWAKQIGLNGSNTPTSLTSDLIGNIYVTGYYESSADFDPSAGTYTITSAGVTDIFLVKLDASGAFSWAGSMGGTTGDYGRSITLDATGNVLITGEFQGTADFDPTAGVYNLTSAGVKDVFVAKFNPATATFVWAVRTGDTNNEIGYDITTDVSNNIYITGDFIGNVDFDPGSGTILISSSGNQRDCFILKLDASGNYMWAGGFGSASLGDDAYSIYVDASSSIYTTGYYQDVVDFDPGAGTSIITSGGQLDAFVQKIIQCTPPVAPVNTTPVSNQIICEGNLTTLTTTSGTNTINWYSTSTSTNVIGTGSSFITPTLAIGTYSYYAESNSCAKSLTRTEITVTVNASPSINASTSNPLICAGETTSLTANGTSTSYTWNTSATGTSISVSPTVTTNYTVTGTDANGCENNAVVTQSVSLCTAINQSTNTTNEVSIFPNPSSTNLTVKTNEEIQIISIYNSLGALVQTKKINTFSVEQLASGLYILKVKTEKGTSTIRFIKE